MSIAHHIDDATLMSFAAGTLAEPLAAVVACHLDMCAECRAALADYDLMGGLMLDATSGPAGDADVPVLAPDALAPMPAAGSMPAGDVPRPLQRLVGASLDAIPWRPLGPRFTGISYVDLPVSKAAKGYLRLMKLAAGVRLPEHGHRGGELTLVLRGGYSDEHGQYAPGDISDNDEAVRHAPVIDADGACISLVAAEAPADYSGLIPRLLQPLTGM
jgi:putative transcriptional regulator